MHLDAFIPVLEDWHTKMNVRLSGDNQAPTFPFITTCHSVSNKRLRHGGSGYEPLMYTCRPDTLTQTHQRRTQDLGGGGGGGARLWAGPQTLTARGYGGAL